MRTATIRIVMRWLAVFPMAIVGSSISFVVAYFLYVWVFEHVPREWLVHLSRQNVLPSWLEVPIVAVALAAQTRSLRVTAASPAMV